MKVYSDGSCLTNPGQGGYAALVINGDKNYLLYCAMANTTNNIMELLGVIEALKFIKYRYGDVSDLIQIYSDSSYVCNGSSQWMEKWNKNNWKTVDGDDVKNKEYWQEMLQLQSVLKTEFIWVRGHSTNMDNIDSKYNNFVDEMARKAARNKAPFIIEEIVDC
jgi:ribonuclease HI